MQPRANLPKPNISLCPKCHRPKSPDEVSCPNCGVRSCPKGHIIISKVCTVCGWEDLNFIKQSPVAGKATSRSSQFDETTTHRIEYECPVCHCSVSHTDVKCPNCGLLGGWQYKGVRGKMPPFTRTPRSGGVTPPLQREYPRPHVERRSPVSGATTSPQLQDMTPKKWAEKMLDEPRSYSAPVRESKVSPENVPVANIEFPKEKFLVAAKIAVLALCVAAVIFAIVINANTIQSAISAMLPKPSVSPPLIVDVTPPTIQQIQNLEITETSVVISWTTDEPSTSQVEYGTTAELSNATAIDGDLVTTHNVRLNTLKSGTTYHYRVISKDADGNTAYGADEVFVTVVPLDTSPPVVSGITVADVSDSTATINWTTDEKATSQIEYGGTSSYDSTTPKDNNLVISHSITLNGLEADKTYYFRVKSVDGNKNETVSDSSQSFRTSSPVPTGLEVGKRAPDFTVYALNREPVTLSKLRGKIVMVNFWAVGCGACVAEMPDIQAVYEAWSGPKKLEVLAINAGDYEQYIRKIVEEKNWTVPVFIDTDRIAVREYKITRIPRTFFIDTSGIIRKIELGSFANQDQIIETLNSLQ